VTTLSRSAIGFDAPHADMKPTAVSAFLLAFTLTLANAAILENATTKAAFGKRT